MQLSAKTIAAFRSAESRIRRKRGCWLWLGLTNRQGYGRIPTGNGEYALAHRASYFLNHGSIRDDLHVCHRCDTPGCINPVHLFQGTAQDNTDDMVAKRRHKFGEAHHWSTLTEKQVLAIRRWAERGWTAEALATKYPVSPGMIRMILRGDVWKYSGGRVREKQEQKGETHSQAKLTWNQVREIRRRMHSGATNWTELATEFGAHPATISHIARGLSWKIAGAPVVATRVQSGATHSQAKLSTDDVIKIRKLRSGGASAKDLAARFGVHFQYVYRLCRGDRRRAG